MCCLDTVTLVTDNAGSEEMEGEQEIQVATNMFPSYANVSFMVLLFYLFAPFLVSVLCFFFDGFLSMVIALPTIAISLS